MLNNSALFGNASANRYFHNQENTHPENIVIVYCVLNAPLMILSIVGNSLVIAAIFGTSSLSSPSTTLLCNLACTDLLIGLVIQPLFIAKELNKHDRVLMDIFEITSFSLCGVSLCIMTAISMDRFAALHYHMKYVSMVTTSRVFYALLAAWLIIFSAVTGLYLWEKMAYFIVSSVFIVLCLFISSFCYIRIFQIVRRHQIQIHIQQQAVQSSGAANSLNIAQLKKSAMNTFVFYTFLLLCYFPIFIILALLGMANSDWQSEWNFAPTLVFLNSALNPILYCWRLSELRGAVIKTARRMLCTKTDQH